MRASVILLGNSLSNSVHEWQYYRLNYQTDVQICNQCVWDNHESAPAVVGNCSPNHNSRYRSSVSTLQAFPWPPSDLHMAITGTKTEHAFIRKHNRSPLGHPMSSDLTLLLSLTIMFWSRWNTCYRVLRLELSFK
ncbi:uncharacterized protein TNCV_2957131 [Trichonephila clavipes]|nr:uncharacterized protein TNCV_2957131 [Trichonephila clavipes]